MQIQDIKIDHIKGIKSGQFLRLNIYPNKPTILVAPNGFGKSSIAIAFDSLSSKGIRLQNDHYYENDQSNKPTIALTIREEKVTRHLTASESMNDISKEYNVFVINNSLTPKASSQNLGKYSATTAKLQVPDIVLKNSIPKSVNLEYKYSRVKKTFGNNGKVLENISSVLENDDLISRFISESSKIKVIYESKTFQKFIDNINLINGKNKEEIIKNINIDSLLKMPSFHKLYAIIEDYYPKHSQTLQCLVAVQLTIVLYSQYGKLQSYKKILEYKKLKNYSNEFLSCLNETWKDIQLKEVKAGKNKRLVIGFPPDVRDISNGERDIYFLLGNLLKIKEKMDTKKDTLLLIDEVFDYLDSSNLLIAQHFISNFIQEFRKSKTKIFPIILTHLNPYFFKNYVFGEMKIHYLNKSNSGFDKELSKIIIQREHSKLGRILANYFLHYNPDKTKSLVVELDKLGLNSDLGKVHKLEEHIASEYSKYEKEKKGYDPVSVCLFLRRKIEECAYSKLLTKEGRSGIIKKKSTRDKLKYALSKDIHIPESYFLLGIVYNDLMHIREDQDWISPIKTKLDNITIKSIIKETVRSFSTK